MGNNQTTEPKSIRKFRAPTAQDLQAFHDKDIEIKKLTAKIKKLRPTHPRYNELIRKLAKLNNLQLKLPDIAEAYIEGFGKRKSRRSKRRFGTKNTCDFSNILYGITGTGVGAATLKLMQEYGSAYVKHTFSEKTKEDKRIIQELKDNADIDKALIKEIEEKFQEARDEAEALHQYRYLEGVMNNNKELSVDEIFELWLEYPTDYDKVVTKA